MPFPWCLECPNASEAHPVVATGKVRRGAFAWEKLYNGHWFRLIGGDDFDSEPHTMASNARWHARHHGFKCRAHLWGSDVHVQFYPMDESLLRRGPRAAQNVGKSLPDSTDMLKVWTPL